LIWFVAPVLAYDLSNQPLEIVLPGSVEVNGWFQSATEDCIVVATKGEVIGIPPELILSVRVTEGTLTGEEFLLWTREQKEVSEPQSTHNPAALASTSAIWAGMPYVLLKDWPAVKGAAIMEGLLLGGLVYGAFYEENMALILPFGLSVVSLRVWTGRDVYAEARRINTANTADSPTFTPCTDAFPHEKR
jgi:hypothetical protein